MNDDDNGAGGSSKSNSITSEHSMQSTGISASSQGSSTNSLPKGVPLPQGGSGAGGGGTGSGNGDRVAALSGLGSGGGGGASAGGHPPPARDGGPIADHHPNTTSSQQSSQIDAAVYGHVGSGGQHQHHHYSNTPTSFHRPTLAQAQGGPSPSLSAKSKLSQVRCYV